MMATSALNLLKTRVSETEIKLPSEPATPTVEEERTGEEMMWAYATLE